MEIGIRGFWTEGVRFRDYSVANDEAAFGGLAFIRLAKDYVGRNKASLET